MGNQVQHEEKKAEIIRALGGGGSIPPFEGSDLFLSVAEKLWVIRPDLVNDLFLVSASDPNASDVVSEAKRMTRNSKWMTKPYLVDGALSAIRKVSPKAYPDHVAETVLSLFPLLDPEELIPMFELLIANHDLAHRQDLHSTPNETWGAVELLVQKIRSMGIISRAGGKLAAAMDEVFNSGKTAICMLMEHGSCIEKTIKITIDGQVFVIQGQLHRACFDHDKNPPNKIAIDTLIECGADWRKLIEKNLISDQARQVIYSHPIVRRELLGQVAAVEAGALQQYGVRM